MASIHTASIVSDIRGSVASETYSRNAAGLYVTERKGPTDNTGANRVATRDALAALSPLWSSTLTDQQRADWRSYAHQHPRPNQWGTPILTSGYNSFMRHNWYRYRDTLALGFPDAPPTPPIVPPDYTFTADESANTLTFAMPPTNYDPPPANMDLYGYVGYEQLPGTVFCQQSWRKLGVCSWDGADWTIDPCIIAYPGTLHVGMKIWTKVLAQLADTGELSRPTQTSAIVQA